MRVAIIAVVVVFGLVQAEAGFLQRLIRADCMACFGGKLSGDSFNDIFKKGNIAAACGAMDAGCVKSSCAGQKAGALADLCGEAGALDKCLEEKNLGVCTADFDGCEYAGSAADCYAEASGCSAGAMKAMRTAGTAFEKSC